MLESHKIKSNHSVLGKNVVDTYWAPVFAPDYSTTALAANMCTKLQDHSRCIRFLCKNGRDFTD